MIMFFLSVAEISLAMSAVIVLLLLLFGLAATGNTDRDPRFTEDDAL